MNVQVGRVTGTVAVVGALAMVFSGPVPSAGVTTGIVTHSLSGTESEAGHTITWSIGGVSPVPADRADLLAYPYDGVIYLGDTVTMAGSAEFTLGAGLVTNLDMTASMGWMMDAKDDETLRKTVSAGTYSMPFNFTLKVPRSRSGSRPAADGALLNAIQAMVTSRNCNDDGVCDGPQAIMYIALLEGKGSGGDRIAPHIRAIPHKGIIGIRSQVPAGYLVSDSGGRSKVYADLYSHGELVASRFTKGTVASGTQSSLMWPASVGGKGPFYYCVWAEDAAGNRSPGAPRSSCAWLSREVSIDKVSTGCGTDAWGPTAEWLQNSLGDERRYGSTTVKIRPACNVHDAGYAGVTVEDPFSGHVVDFREWSRADVDRKFMADVRSICRKALNTPKERADRTTCMNGIALTDLKIMALLPAGIAVGMPQIGALTYYEAVSTHGGVGYDWDASIPGTQQAMPTSTDPRGGGRNGA